MALLPQLNDLCLELRGLNFPHKQDEVRKFVNFHRLSLIGLLETRVRYGNRLKVAENLLLGWRLVFNYQTQGTGWIWAAWDPSVLSVQLLSSSAQLLHLAVQILETQEHFLISFVYGLNYPQDRVPLWDAIASISQTSSHLPWALMGDFNVTRMVTEKMGGNTSWTPDMEAINTCYNAELEDLQHRG